MNVSELPSSPSRNSAASTNVEKLTRLRAKLEELRHERERINNEIRDRQRKMEEIDGVIRRFLQLNADTIAEQRANRKKK